MKLKYPNSLPFVFALVAAIPFVSHYFALMFGELFFGRPSSTWAIGFVWIPFLIFPPLVVGFILGSLLWIYFRYRKKAGEVPKKAIYALAVTVTLFVIAGVGLGLIKVAEHEKYHTPGVSVGKNLLEKEQFLANDKLRAIRSITTGKAVVGRSLIVVGEEGALTVEANGAQGDFVSFDRRVGETIPIEGEEGQGPFHFMNRGGGWQPVSRLDSNGRTLWMYPSENPTVKGDAADSIAAGDLNRDGRLEFVVGMNGGGGLRLLDSKGKEIWKQAAGNVFSVEILTYGSKGVPTIFHSDAGEGIVVRNADGEKIKTIKNCGAGSFSVLSQPTTRSRPLLVCDDDNGLRLVDLEDNVVRIFKLPGYGHTPQGTLVHFSGPNSPPYYAFARTIQATGQRSDLTVFDSNGTLVYHEKIEASYLAISSLTDKEKRIDALLVGENSRVWLYRMRLHN